MTTVGLLSALVGVGGSTSGDGAERASAAKPQAGAASRYLLKRPFGRGNCTIGRIGADPCGKNTYGVLSGKYVRVALRASGGKKITFRVYKKGTDKVLGKQDMEAGDRKTIWTNHTNHQVNVSFTADAEGLVETVATGLFLFGPY